VLRKMRAGQLHGGAFTSGSLRALYPDVDLYSVPLMFRTFEEVDYVRERLDPALRAGLEQAGLVVLAITDGGFAHLLSEKPVRNIGDLSGSKVWVQEDDVMSRTALEIAGVAPVPLPIGDVYTGLQTGLLDTLAAPPMAAIAFQWHTKVKYFTDVPLMYLAGVFALDQRAFAKLRPEDREVVRRIVAESSRRLDAEGRVGHTQALRALADQGVEPVSASSAEELERWHQIADQSLGKLRQGGVYSPELIDALLAELGEYRGEPPATHAR
jgi:TRAP-type C4-dicarboxylate transport system substrate-binding protein